MPAAISDQRLLEMVAMRRQGATYPEIARAFGATESWVAKRLRPLNLPNVPRRQDPTKRARNERIVAMRDAGVSQREIAATVGLSERGVASVLTYHARDAPATLGREVNVPAWVRWWQRDDFIAAARTVGEEEAASLARAQLRHAAARAAA